MMNSQKQNKKVLFILPHADFQDKEYTWIVERLDEAKIEHEVASSHISEAQGRFGTIVKPDITINFVSSGDYDGFIFVGGEGAKEYYARPDVVSLIIKAINTHKLIVAIGLAVPTLGYSGLLSSRRVTGPAGIQPEIEGAGAFFTGRLVEQDGDIITANGPYATIEVAETFIKALQWASSEGTGRPYLR